MRHNCALCGQISFTTYHEYEAHRREFHMLKTEIKPENITGRSRAQIVAEAERTWLQPHLIMTVAPTLEEVAAKKETPASEDAPALVANTEEHLEACRCNECFNKRLDALIASQEAALALQSNNDIIN